MLKVEEFQNYGKEQFDAAVASAGTCTKSLQAIATAYTDYAKKSYEEGSAFLEKLAGVRSLDKAIEVQTDYAKTAYETFVAETRQDRRALQGSRQGDLQAVRRLHGEDAEGRPDQASLPKRPLGCFR